MKADQARRNKRKKLLGLRKNKTWLSVIIYLIIAVLAFVLFSLLIHSTLSTTLIDKLRNENDNVRFFADIYDADTAADKSAALAILDGTERSYFIRKSDGSILHENGTVTCGSERSEFRFRSGNKIVIHSEDTSILVYPDTANQTLRLENDGYYVLNFNRFLETASSSVNLIESDEALLTQNLVEMPVWISQPLHSDGSELVCRAVLIMNASDLVIFTAILLGIGFLAILLFLIMLITVISGAVNQHKVTKMFFTDLVTKGHNWMWFLHKGEQLLHRHRRQNYAVADLEIVRYRTFCVCHSLEEGEALLGQIYEYLHGQLDKRKELCVHSTDGDFAILLRYTDPDALKKRVNELISGAVRLDSTRRFAFHAGIRMIEPQSGKSRRALPDLELEFSNACAARASLDATDDSASAFFDEKLVEEQRWIDTVQKSQQAALDNEEFVVYYQPKYDPRTNQLRGAEALIRWQSPEHGFIPPGKFIPIFEKNGFITEIDHYMVCHVAKDQKRWLDEGYRCVPVSVNVSRAHFIESDLAEQIRDMVDEAGTPHELIEIELTESAFFDDKNALIRTISRLKEYGFAVSMDDFGSGYSSLNSLKDMPLDVLKLDAEFFRGKEAGTDRGEIVVTEAIRLAKNLNMRTVAEGVEVREQVDFLAKQGCDMIQGYYFAKPMPGADYEQRMKDSPEPDESVSE